MRARDGIARAMHESENARERKRTSRARSVKDATAGHPREYHIPSKAEPPSNAAFCCNCSNKTAVNGAMRSSTAQLKACDCSNARKIARTLIGK